MGAWNGRSILTAKTYEKDTEKSRFEASDVIVRDKKIRGRRHLLYMIFVFCGIAFCLFAAALSSELVQKAQAETVRHPISFSASAFASGSGTEADPYVISGASGLEAFRDSVNAGNAYEGAYIVLAADVDISGVQWTPIGASTRQSSGVTGSSTPFKGNFDGGGHTVSGLTITPSSGSGPGADYALGLFGAVLGGTVANMKLTEVDINAPDSELAGGALGLLSGGGVVSGIQVSGTLKAKCGTGGVVGRMTANGTISDCVNAAVVQVSGGSGNCGGIVGAAYYTPENSRMEISNCINKGTITGVNDTGGIAGLCCAFVSGCENAGAISGNGYAVGGIAGEMKCYGAVSKCTNSATVTNPSSASPYGTGGIVGWVRYDGTTPAYATVAPIDVTDNVNTASVTTTSGIGVGGIVGVLYSSGSVTGNENSAPSLSGSQFVAGIVGNVQDQGASTLPASIKEDAVVSNNISTTPLSAMSGSFTDLYAYNNTPTLFTVSNNSPRWEAVDSSTGSLRYATLMEAVSRAADGDTVTLLSDVDGAGMLEAQPKHDITIDLAGHSVAFAAGGGITARGDSVTIVGSGDVYALTAAGAIDPEPKLFETAADSNGVVGKIFLKGGTYPVDVAEYVAPGYEVSTVDGPNAHDNRFQVVVARTSDSTTTNTTNANTSNTAQREVASPAPTNTHVGSDPNRNTPAQTSDEGWVALLLLGATILISGGVMAFTARRIRREG